MPNTIGLTVDWVLRQFARTRSRLQDAYEQFVADGQTRGMAPWEQVQGQIYLESEEFLQHLQRRIGPETTAEIPLVQRQPGRPTLATIVRQVAREYGRSEEEVRQFTRRPGEARQVAVYAARRIARSDLQTIGRYFGMSYTGVSRRVQAVATALQHDTSFRQRGERILAAKKKS